MIEKPSGSPDRKFSRDTEFDTIADALTGASGDTSGLMSVMIGWLGRGNSPDREAVRARAKAGGIAGLWKRWEETPTTRPIGEDVVLTLIPEAALERFSRETGLSHDAVLTALTNMLPQLARMDEIHQVQTERAHDEAGKAAGS
ncbi:hypothetical protein ACMAUO_15440 [Gluconacetobacter sp. Hr-1-5]|uniref:hypothetical protein n=1 Tax=Gluconacetobacter sp. Hr-1-5 TaxID=3395370 RepID=UPI003B51D41F